MSMAKEEDPSRWASSHCHTGEGRYPRQPWIPAFGGMTTKSGSGVEQRRNFGSTLESKSVRGACVTARRLAEMRTSHCAKGETAMPFYQKGDVRIRYEETGTGFPLLVTPGGGL